MITAHKEGYEDGLRDALTNMANHIDDVMRKSGL